MSTVPTEPAPPGGPAAPAAASAVQVAEQKKKRATAIRVFVYVAVTHLWAALLIIMFAVGRH
ncbi:DUF6126 family protein [Peterkaempfera sp. SMS 1(5)a]|uniref:DUF6126 family protein n=1 Tax=Peterkaempfera podocarpi TaxID=3232308 RepID=UPI00366B4A56